MNYRFQYAWVPAKSIAAGYRCCLHVSCAGSAGALPRCAADRFGPLSAQPSKMSDLTGVALPESASYRATGTKKILVDIGRELLPPGMDEQPKRGFAMPFGHWMKRELREVVNDTLADATIRNRGLFESGEVAALKRNFDNGVIGWPQPWLLMMTELWCREVLDQRDEV